MKHINIMIVTLLAVFMLGCQSDCTPLGPAVTATMIEDYACSKSQQPGDFVKFVWFRVIDIDPSNLGIMDNAIKIEDLKEGTMVGVHIKSFDMIYMNGKWNVCDPADGIIMQLHPRVDWKRLR